MRSGSTSEPPQNQTDDDAFSQTKTWLIQVFLKKIQIAAFLPDFQNFEICRRGSESRGGRVVAGSWVFGSVGW